MSFSSLARRVQGSTDYSFVAARNKVLEVKEEAEQIANDQDWSLADAVEYLVVGEWKAHRSGVYVSRGICDNCYLPYFVSLDKKGEPDYYGEHCEDCRKRTLSCDRCGCEVYRSKPREDDDFVLCGNCSDHYRDM